MIVIDTNDDVSGKLSYLPKKGVGAIGRYYASEKGKRSSPSEAEASAAAGLKLFMVFEDNGDPPLGGNAGSTDAKRALDSDMTPPTSPARSAGTTHTSSGRPAPPSRGTQGRSSRVSARET